MFKNLKSKVYCAAGFCFVILIFFAMASLVFAATVVQSGSTLYSVNQVLVGCDNNVVQKLIEDLYLDGDDCMIPGLNSARIKLIQTGATSQLLLVGDDVGLEAAVEALRDRNFYSSALQNIEVIVARNPATNEITASAVNVGAGSSVVPSLTSLGGGSYEFTFPLSQGWNFVSFPLVLSDDDPDSVFGALGLKIIRVYSYDPSMAGVKWTKWNPEAGAPSEITDIKPQKGYILYMDDSATLVVQGMLGVGASQTPPSLSLSSGWNLITLHGFSSKHLSSALSSVSGKYDSVWTIVDYEDVALDINADPLLQPGRIYWIHMTDSGVLVPS